MGTRRIEISFIIASAICVFGCRAKVDPSDPKAILVMDQMASVYAECETYSDTGDVTTVFHMDQGDRTVVKPFSTVMIRPGQFRFEFTEQGRPQSDYIVWQNGGDVRTWWGLKQQVEREDSLGMGLAGATGVSSGSAHTIPSLLMPDEIGGRLLTELESAQLGSKQMIGEHLCLTIEALHGGDPITIWIDEQSFLVRRIDSTSVFDDFTTSEMTTYDPVINEEIDAKRLEFNAPGQ